MSARIKGKTRVSNSQSGGAEPLIRIAIGIVVILMALLPEASITNSYGPGLAEAGTRREPRWISRLMLILIGLAAIYDGIWEITHN